MQTNSMPRTPSAEPPPIPGWGAESGYANATVTKAPQPALARAWVTFVTGPAGQAALKDAGFGGAGK